MSLTPVSVLTGFLGSGKTTLLNGLLADPHMAETAVLVNEFGDVGIDHLLVEALDDDVVLLNAGCTTDDGDDDNVLVNVFATTGGTISASGEITVTVFDNLTRLPVAGAAVLAANGVSAATNASGVNTDFPMAIYHPDREGIDDKGRSTNQYQQRCA